MVYLKLSGAKVLEVQGLGGNAFLGGPITLKLEDDGVIALYSWVTFLGWKKFCEASWQSLELLIGASSLQTGGGWVGGGFGLEGAVKGALTVAVLNRLTARSRDYTVLTIIVHNPETDTERMISLGFQKVGESELKNQLLEAIPAWIEPTVKQIEVGIRNASDEYVPAITLEIGNYIQWGILAGEQRDRIVTLLEEKNPAAFAPDPVSQPALASRADQLRMLAEMRTSGALSEDEFQAEKELILAS